MPNLEFHPIFVALLLSFACDGETPPSQGEQRGLYETSKADALDSCVGACDGQSSSGCWCDEECAAYGDCCPDVESVCSEGCPALSPPGPNFCPNGEISPVHDAVTGCLQTFECLQCPALNPPGPDFCPNGNTVPVVDPDTGCIETFDCHVCPGIAPPGPNFCPEGEVVPVFDPTTGCLKTFECKQPAE